MIEDDGFASVDDLEDAITDVLLDALESGLTPSDCDAAIMEAQKVLWKITALNNGAPTITGLVN